MRIALSAMLMVPALAQVRDLPSPASEASAEPNLVVLPGDRVLLSWIAALDGGHALRFAVLDDGKWSKPRQVASGGNWFVNWADFPSVAALPDGRLAAHWLVKSADGTYDYDVHIAHSSDGGGTWSKSLIPHRDGAKAEHGFVSLLANEDSVLSAFWLDGRDMVAEQGHGHGRGSMTLRYVEILKGGALRNEALLDARVCECCQTSAAMSAAGPLVVFRDRSQDEVRDISIVRRVDGVWTAPRPVFRDGWKIAGCPVNGPSVAASGRHVVVGWFTGADNTGRVKFARSTDAGASFGEPSLIDRGNPIGRVEVVVAEDGAAWVCWMTRTDDGAAVRARRVAADNTLSEAVTIAETEAARRNGFPQVVRCGGRLVFAWTNQGVQVASMPLPK